MTNYNCIVNNKILHLDLRNLEYAINKIFLSISDFEKLIILGMLNNLFSNSWYDNNLIKLLAHLNLFYKFIMSRITFIDYYIMNLIFFTFNGTLDIAEISITI